ncbi:PDZ domain-containing protein GIPC1 [Portunus trituberculatus]|uniref:PDZ domain-containing protein GIPC1 n=1 Tax=Portunus trituberculatus TaxID=210409 RepID=A0A5B7CXS8_PORTR|nr:PDZ domain-containing protein GIPC1 [Portunus trituberculatus]
MTFSPEHCGIVPFFFFAAAQIWELGQQKQNTMEFAEAVDDSDLEAFGFTDDFIFELWGAITDAKAGRLKK